jgi:hypothetical protein
MKQADLVVGEFYAYQPRQWGNVAKVEVLETGVHRHIPSRTYCGSGGPSKRADGVRVREFVHDGRPVNTGPCVVLSKHILKTWEEHVEHERRADVHRRRHEARREQLRRGGNAALDTLGLDLGSLQGTNHPYVQIGVEDLQKLAYLRLAAESAHRVLRKGPQGSNGKEQCEAVMMLEDALRGSE